MDFIKQQELAICSLDRKVVLREWIVGVSGAVVCYGALIWLVLGP